MEVGDLKFLERVREKGNQVLIVTIRKRQKEKEDS